MEEKEMNVLDELHKGTCMGMDAICYIIDKVQDQEFKDVLKTQYDQYEKIGNRIKDMYPEYADKDPKETNTMDKAMTWWGINMKTMNDHSNSKIAELLMQGTNMGIIEGRKLLNHKDTDANVEELVSEYVEMQERAVERLKQFL